MYLPIFRLLYIFGRKLRIGFSPFALSLAAVSGVGAEGIFAAAGAVFGYFLFGGLSVYMRYMVSVVLCFVCFFVLRPLKISQSKYFRPAVAAIITASTGFVYITNALTAVSFCSEILTVFYSAFAFKPILSPRPADADYRYGISASLFISVLCAGLSGLSLFSVLSLGRVASTSILLLISFKCGYGKACPFGIICGIIMDLAGGKGLFFSLVYPVSAAVSSAFSGRACSLSRQLCHGKLFIRSSPPGKLFLYSLSLRDFCGDRVFPSYAESSPE